MGIKKTEDFQIPIGGGSVFSSRKENFTFFQSLELARPGETEPPLQMAKLTDLIAKTLSCRGSLCLWLVETAPERVISSLQELFPDHSRLGSSLAGYSAVDADSIARFWSVRSSLERVAPWDAEPVWLMAGLNSRLKYSARVDIPFLPNAWTAERVFSHAALLDSIFVQQGWFGYLGFRTGDEIGETIQTLLLP